MKTTTRAAIAVLSFACVIPAQAQHDAHEHGHATLNVVLDGAVLAIELEVPAANVVGFEHQPENDAQWQRSEQALRQLAEAQDVFTIPKAGGCSLREAELALPGVHLHDGEIERTEVGHQEHGHKDEDHGQKGEDHGHKDDDEDHAEQGEIHGELVAGYQWQCTNPQSLTEVDVKLFQRLEGLEELTVQVVTPSRQAAVELSPGSTRVPLVR